MVDANYTDSDKTEYVAKVVYDDYDGLENAIENGDVELDTYALENDIITADGKVVDKEVSPHNDKSYISEWK
jgi:transcription initiation factor IIF auxiliary subunit